MSLDSLSWWFLAFGCVEGADVHATFHIAMVRSTGSVMLPVLLLFAAWASAAPPELPWSGKGSQKVILNPSLSDATQSSARKLQGKFLHITGDVTTALPSGPWLIDSFQTYILIPSTMSIPTLTKRVTPAKAEPATMVQKSQTATRPFPWSTPHSNGSRKM